MVEWRISKQVKSSFASAIANSTQSSSSIGLPPSLVVKGRDGDFSGLSLCVCGSSVAGGYLRLLRVAVPFRSLVSAEDVAAMMIDDRKRLGDRGISAEL